MTAQTVVDRYLLDRCCSSHPGKAGQGLLGAGFEFSRTFFDILLLPCARFCTLIDACATFHV
jgi:hypothetical protein